MSRDDGLPTVEFSGTACVQPLSSVDTGRYLDPLAAVVAALLQLTLASAG